MKTQTGLGSPILNEPVATRQYEDRTERGNIPGMLRDVYVVASWVVGRFLGVREEHVVTGQAVSKSHRLYILVGIRQHGRFTEGLNGSLPGAATEAIFLAGGAEAISAGSPWNCTNCTSSGIHR